MEIIAKPRRRGGSRALRAAIGAGALLAVAFLIPPALGYQTHVVDDHAMTGIHARGSLVFDEQVPQGQLEIGDAVTFVPPGADLADGTVTRRIVAIGDDAVRTRGDAAASVDPWRVPLADGNLNRVAFSLPWAGYPMLALSSLALPPWAPAALALGVAAALVLLRRRTRPVAPHVGVRASAGAGATPPFS